MIQFLIKAFCSKDILDLFRTSRFLGDSISQQRDLSILASNSYIEVQILMQYDVTRSKVDFLLIGDVRRRGKAWEGRHLISLFP